MCLAGFLIILFPVGIANFILGYVMGDSPCALCWGQREAMIFIGVIALFIVRFGIKPKYIAALLIVTAFGLYQSFAHFGNHAGRDLDQGFSIMIFGLHTYFWAEVVFWAVILLLGVMLIFAPSFKALETAKLTFGKYKQTAFIVCAFVVASNILQAFVSTGIPPYLGQGDPVRFSFNPKNVVWSTEGWNETWSGISFLGKRDVKDPDYAFAPTKVISFNHNANQSPFEKIDRSLKIVDTQVLPFNQPLNTLNSIDNTLIASSKFDVYFLDKDFKVEDSFELDPNFSATINPIVGIVPFMQDKYLLMGSNKTLLRFARNPNADAQLQYADFIKGADRFEGRGENLGRNRLDTVRSKFHHTLSVATDGKYFYLATVPNNKDKNTFVISQFLEKDQVLSAEFTPKADLKPSRSLGDLYITSMVSRHNKLYALSKQYNVIIIIDPLEQKVEKVISYPENITNARALLIEGDKIKILSYEDKKNLLYTLD
ncbi:MULTISPECIES: disulfide bond formation protein B [unclassified Helicobacter]|uniref:disulfide bond formation protein B n=1 Tax=unclassified Helicobacter TaxID=2593540 RepID=UPI000CF1A43F|nr:MULTISPECIES: disulfide bond formation protein B [unclassified Helicobacter]